MILKLKTLFITFLILFVSFQSIIPNTSYAEYDAKLVKGQKVKIEKNDEFAEFVMINDIENNDKAAIRYVNKNPNHNNFTVCVNAGHGTSGGMRDAVRTKCHPDGTSNTRAFVSNLPEGRRSTSMSVFRSLWYCSHSP